MEFTIYVKHEGEDDKEAWQETYDKPYIKTVEKANIWAQFLIEEFNATLRKNEQRRVLVNVEFPVECVDLEEQSKSKGARRARIAIADEQMNFGGDLLWLFDNADNLLEDDRSAAKRILSLYSFGTADPAVRGMLKAAIQEYRREKGV